MTATANKPSRPYRPPLPNPVGHQYGDLLVVGRAPTPYKANNTFWYCQCVHGNIVTCRRRYLEKHLQDATCRCDLPNPFANNFRKNRSISYGIRLRAFMRQGAKERSLPFDLTAEQIWTLSQQECIYCGTQGSNHYTLPYTPPEIIHYNGLDRVDNTKGYTISNVVPCCITCNKAKQQMTVEEFESWICQVYNRIKGNTKCKTLLDPSPKIGSDIAVSVI